MGRVMDLTDKVELLTYAVRGVELDEREQQMLAGAAATWDDRTIEIWCSFMEKIREAGMVQVVDLDAALMERAARRHSGQDRPII
jgi:hypothetical protein